MPEVPRVLAFYLPQYHPIPENDMWWGRGFTEWRNVAQGRPLFRGHQQPHLPGELGFYDLRLPETREAQADLAAGAGLSGFVYYHYWFGGRRLLHRPFDEVLASGRPGFPFALCWANENWTRAWDGGTDQVLIGQSHSDEDDIAHLDLLADAFGDQRYIRVDGKPLFLVYRAARLPDARRTTDLWRSRASALGLGELFLVRVESFPDETGRPTDLGFDASVGWEPRWGTFGKPLMRTRLARQALRLRVAPQAYRRHDIYEYDTFVRTRRAAVDRPGYERFPCVVPSWDNSVRRTNGRATIMRGATPAIYEEWLREALAASARDAVGDHRLVFLNAWNEWAEGNHIEPDARWGRAYLDATARAIADARTAADRDV